MLATLRSQAPPIAARSPSTQAPSSDGDVGTPANRRANPPEAGERGELDSLGGRHPCPTVTAFINGPDSERASDGHRLDALDAAEDRAQLGDAVRQAVRDDRR